MDDPNVIALIPLPQRTESTLRQRYKVVPFGEAGHDLGKANGSVRVVVTNGSTGLRDPLMATFTNLEFIAVFGAGYENVDINGAQKRGIKIANAPGTNTETVADHAIGLTLALARGFTVLDRAVKSGKWRESRQERPTLSGAKLGILGMGQIGSAIARRAQAFGMSIAYSGRRKRMELPFAHYATAGELAQNSDFLVVCCPGGAATRHIVDADVLAALGSQGMLVNVSRGSTVDTIALIDALRNNVIGGAALDVVEGEPDLPAALLQLDNVILTPHMAGRSPASVQAQHDALLVALEAHFSNSMIPNLVTVNAG